MAAVPTQTEVAAYLADVGLDMPTDDRIAAAYAAELADQTNRCRHTDDPADWPAALAGALMRRVAHHVAVAALPLGYQATLTENAVATSSVGGTDPEVRRLEAPYRRTPVG